MSNKTRFRKALRKTIQPQTGWLDVFDAMIGKADGTITTDVPGEVWVRNILNGQELRVRNSTVSNKLNLQVEVGRRVDDANIWQIKRERSSFSAPAASGTIAYHFHQHVLFEGDSGLYPRKQIRELTVLVADAAAFIVQVYGGSFDTLDGPVLVDNQQKNVASYIPSAGAIYLNLETDKDGVVTLHPGNTFGTKENANKIYIPIPENGQARLCSILLYERMEALLNEHIVLPTAVVMTRSDIILQADLEAQLSLKADIGHNHPGLAIYMNTNFC